MGSCLTSNDATTLEKLLDEEIRKCRKADEQIKKILFLGNGGSGKSTLCKQLRLIHDDSYPDTFRKECIPYIHQQLVEDMQLAIEVYIKYHHRKTQLNSKTTAAVTHKSDGKDEDEDEYHWMDLRDDDLWVFDELDLGGLEIQDLKSAEFVKKYQYNKQSQTLGPGIVAALKSLRDEAAIQRIYECRNITHLQTSTKYFWENLDAIASPNYLPSEHDIILNRKKTSRVREYRFENKERDQIVDIIDIGGQKSERRKWIHCFEHVVAVIFVANLANYDESLEEDDSVNAMCDQIDLFRDIVNQDVLSNLCIILFLNKEDLFREKYCVNHVPLTTCNYLSEWQQKEDEWQFEPAAAFVAEQFMDQNEADSEPIIFHYTTAISTRNVRNVFENVHEIIVSNNILNTGLVDSNGFEEIV